jgi:SAM-dependent methyltransferase
VTRRPTHPAIWEELAQRDAQYHIDPTLGPGASPEEFREGGRGIVDWAMAWAGELPANGRALEIGCGTGRNTIHLARHFRQVDGVDVSPTMVHLALAQGMPSNVRLHSLSGRDLQPLDDGTFDLVFSHLVFQHIEKAADIAAYLREIARVLRIDGVAVIQFDTRPATLAVRLAQALPNALLPPIAAPGSAAAGATQPRSGATALTVAWCSKPSSRPPALATGCAGVGRSAPERAGDG